MRVTGAKGEEGAGLQEPFAEKWGDDSEVRILTRRTGVLLQLSVIGLLLIARTILVDINWVHLPPSWLVCRACNSACNARRHVSHTSHDISAYRLVLRYR